MEITFTDAKPADSRALIGLAGPQGSGKTASALRLATGIVKDTGGDILYIDTEKRRALKYSESFKFKHFDFHPPFTAESYLEVLLAADKQAKPGSVIIVDSMSHEHEGMGGLLERSEEFLERTCGTDYKKRDKMLMASIIKPKMARTRLIQNGLQRVDSYLILCFRAKEKVKPIKVKQENGFEKTEIKNLGIQVIGGDEYGYEVDVMFVLPAGAQGKPDWNEPASRINDMKGDLIHDLKEIPQINEAMGKKMKEFFSARVDDSERKDRFLSEAQSHAKLGTVALQDWWKTIGPASQKLIVDSMPPIKDAAAKADKSKLAEMPQDNEPDDVPL
jgi:energy-coupling factor transporter ATP-binding protein EcfA2